jgi:predicted enzyme related to lactoylglutathione lyase
VNDAGLTHICFDVVDVDAEYARLRDLGVEFHTEPVEFGGTVRTTYGRDPDGNVFELQEVIALDLAIDLENVVPDIRTQVIK